MTENTIGDDTEIIADSGSDVNEILTDGFMEKFMPSLENIQEKLGELT